MGMEAYLSAPATTDYGSEGSSRKISRNIPQDLLPLNTGHRITFYITDLGLGVFSLERIHKRNGDVHFDPEISDGNICRMNVGEGKVLLVVVRDVPSCLRRFVGR